MTSSISGVLFGTDEPLPESIPLRAGPLALVLRSGRLWDIRVGEIELWHGVAFLFRDPDWGTPEPIVDHVESTIAEQSFSIRLVGRFPTSPVIDFRVDVEGSTAGCIRFAGEAVPRGDISTNRLGLCVMHPMTAAGARIEVRHTDGRASLSTFPKLIPPWPPFMLVRAIRHEYAPNRWARCELEGDSFEVEDQRNNSDASFKTYSRSNLMPRPYRLSADVPIRQSVELSVEAPLTHALSRRTEAVVVRLGNDVGKLPQIGVAISMRDGQADEATRSALAEMYPAHLHLALEASAGVAAWKRIGELLSVSRTRLRLDVTVANVAQAGQILAALRDDLRDADVIPASVAVFPSEQRCIDAARLAFPTSSIGGGTPHFFVQLNRLESPGVVDFLTFTTSPIVHGADDESVMLTLQSLPSMIDTLEARFPGVPVRIGPSSIAARASPLGSQPKTDGTRRIALAQQDPRCRSLYGAAWLLGYVAQLATTGVDAITLMSLSGSTGILAPADGDVAKRYPSYFVIKALRGPARVWEVTISEPSRIAALALARGSERELLLANLTGDAVDVEVKDWAASFDVAIMDAHAWETSLSTTADPWTAKRRCAESTRLRLQSYAVARLEGRG